MYFYKSNYKYNYKYNYKNKKLWIDLKENREMTEYENFR